MQRTEWFKRQFPPIADNGLLPSIIERLEGTPARLRSKMAKINGDMTLSVNGKWSINKEIGHLIDLEPLWLERMIQIIQGQVALKVADLTNQKTHEANHDEVNVQDLITRFEIEREHLLQILRHLTEQDLEKSSLHPRLGTPMKVIDLAFFVAEHDDHHLAQITYLASSL